MNPDRWLTSKRLRAHGLLFAATIWTFYLWTLANPGLRDRYGNLKGTDFLHFYTLGSLAMEHRGGDLYSIDAQATLAALRVPEAAGIRYLPSYPPQFSLLFCPFAHLSYRWALTVWWSLTLLLYAICCYAVWKVCPRLRHWPRTAALLCFAYPAFFHLIAWGQTSAIALACFTCAFLLLRNHREFGAGLAFGCLAFKPQLALAVAIVFLAIQSWKILVGGIISAVAQFSCGFLYYGGAAYRDWLRTLARIPVLLPAFEPRPYQTHCLRTFWSMIIPWDSLAFGLYVLSSVVVLVWTISIWKSREPLSLRYFALLLAAVLVSPHLTVYDLVILAPGILLVVDWMMSEPLAPSGMGTLVYLVSVLPLVGPFTRFIHVQLSVVAMMALLYMIWRMQLRLRSAVYETVVSSYRY